MSVKHETAAGICRKAAEVIEERGHAKSTFVDSNGAVCAVGALRIAAGFDPALGGRTDVTSPFWQATQAVDRRVPGLPWGITAWNDRSTADEVTSTLRAVADELEQATSPYDFVAVSS